jgi:hypothetical protein
MLQRTVLRHRASLCSHLGVEWLSKRGMICPTCNHDSKEPAVHVPGQCKQCNCGESALCSSSYNKWATESSPEVTVPLRAAEIGNMDVRDRAAHIRGNLYTRRGLPRRQPLYR